MLTRRPGLRPHAAGGPRARAQALQEPAHFEALGCGAEVQREVLGKQLMAFNAALAAVQAAL